MRTLFVVGSVVVTVTLLALSWFHPWVAWSFLIVGPLIARGFADLLQTRQAVRRNFPLIGNFRYLFELIRPEINQYFVESNTDGVPFNRDMRSLVYQRSQASSPTRCPLARGSM